MNTTVRKFAVGLASAALVASVAAPAFAEDANTENTNTNTSTANRWAGEDRFDTAIEIAKKIYPSNQNISGTTVYIANGSDAHLIDAVAAGSIADGPLLLVNEDPKVQEKVKDAIVALRGNKVTAIGGTTAVPDSVLSKVAAGTPTARIAGEDRYETAVKIADALNLTPASASQVYLGNGVTMVDALVAGQLTKGDAPILLTDGSGNLPLVTANYLAKIGKGGTDNITALGGEKAVTERELAQAISNNSGSSVAKYDELKTAAQTAAKAEMVQSGYLTVADGISLDDFMKKVSSGSPTLEDYFKASTSFPKVPMSIAKKTASNALYKLTEADGTLKVVDATSAGAPGTIEADGQVLKANVTAVTAPSVAAKEGQGIFTYTGTVGALKAAETRRDAIGQYGYKSGETDDSAAEWPVTAGLIGSSTNANIPGDPAYTPDNTSTAIKTGIASKLVAAATTTGTGLFGTGLAASTAPDANLRLSKLGTTAAGGAGVLVVTGGTGLLSGTSANVVSVDDIQLLWPDKNFDAGTPVEYFLDALGVDTPMDYTHGYKGDSGSVTDTTVKEATKQFKAQVATAAKEATKAAAAAKKADDAAVAAETLAKGKLDAFNDYVENAKVPSRLAGETRYETALAIAFKKFGSGRALNNKNVYFVNGEAFADAAVSGLIDNSSVDSVVGPVVLVTKNEVPAEVAKYVAQAGTKTQGVALGGTGVVSDATLTAGQEAIAKDPLADTKVSFSLTGDTYHNADGTVASADLATTTVSGKATVTATEENLPYGSKVAYTVLASVDGGATWKATNVQAITDVATVTASTVDGKTTIKVNGKGTTNAGKAVQVKVVATVNNSAGTKLTSYTSNSVSFNVGEA